MRPPLTRLETSPRARPWPVGRVSTRRRGPISGCSAQGDAAMNTITVKKLEDIEAYAGPHAIPGIRFRPAREALGVSSWGMSVLELDPHCSSYPEHDHADDGHEEVYVVLRGSIVLLVAGEERTLSAG